MERPCIGNAGFLINQMGFKKTGFTFRAIIPGMEPFPFPFNFAFIKFPMATFKPVILPLTRCFNI